MKWKKVLKAGVKYICSSDYRFLINAGFGKYNSMNDEDYLKKKYSIVMGKELDLEDPQTFNEKLQWLKLYDRKPEYTMMVDKIEVRQYIEETIGKEYLIPCLGTWDRAEDINFDELPNQFVLKCNHNSGLGLCICKDKASLNIKKTRTDLNKGLKQNYFYAGREWPYKNVKPRIIAEKLLVNNSGMALKDYKIQCFNGAPDNILVCEGRFEGNEVQYYYYDTNWKFLPYDKKSEFNNSIEKPKKLKEMLNIATILSRNIPEVRVDLYEIEEKIYFGELTFFTNSGFDTTITKEADFILGKKLRL